jgi:hypothetical protein
VKTTPAASRLVGTARGLETAGAGGGICAELHRQRSQADGRGGLLAALLRLPGRSSNRPASCAATGRTSCWASAATVRPLVFAAALLGYPTAIQEQNSLPGFTNRVLGRLVGACSSARTPSLRAARRFLGNPALHVP